MKLYLFPIITVTLILMWSMQAPAQAEKLRCFTGMPFVQINPIIEPTLYVRNVDSETLTDEQGMDGSGHFVGGTGGGSISLDTTIKFEYKTLGAQGCVSIESIKGIYSAQPIIHIAREFNRGSCEYEAVLEHEQKHIKVLRQFHQKYDFKVKQEIRKMAQFYQSKGPIPAATMKEHQEYVSNKIQELVTAYNEQIMEELHKKQEAIDSQKEYDRVRAKCKGWARVNLH